MELGMYHRIYANECRPIMLSWALLDWLDRIDAECNGGDKCHLVQCVPMDLDTPGFVLDKVSCDLSVGGVLRT